MTPAERAEALELLPVLGASETARRYGKTPGAIVHMAKRRKDNHAEIIKEREKQAILHGLDNLDASCTELANVLQAALNALKEQQAEAEATGTPYSVDKSTVPIVQAINQTAQTLGKFRKWGTDTATGVTVGSVNIVFAPASQLDKQATVLVQESGNDN